MAGSFSISYTGGSASYGTYTRQYSLNTSTSQYGGGIQYSGTCGGQITATLTWQPNGTLQSDPPPTAVIIEQYSCAMWEGTPWPLPGTGTCDDGLGDPAVTGTSGGLFDTDTSEGTHYKVDTSGNASIPVTCTPTATYVYAGGGLGAPNVEYEVTAYPVQIVPTGTTPDSLTVGQKDILIGQQCGASISGIPSGYNIGSGTWFVSGRVFTAWNPTLAASGPDPTTFDFTSTSANPSWYWDDQTADSETISCNLTISPITSGLPAIPPFQVKATVSVRVPTYVATSTGTAMTVVIPSDCGFDFTDSGDYWLNACVPVPVGTSDPGMSWEAEPFAPINTTFSAGGLNIIQIRTKNQNWTLLGGVTGSDAGTGLDGSFPYQNAASSADYTEEDSPGMDLLSPNALVQAQDQDSFVDFLMYTPPSAGYSIQSVPIATFSWNLNADVESSNGNWANYNAGFSLPGSITPSGSAIFTRNPEWPTWEQDF